MRGRKPEIPAIIPLDAAKHQKPMRPIHELVFPSQLVVLTMEQAKKDPVLTNRTIYCEKILMPLCCSNYSIKNHLKNIQTTR